MQNKKAFMCIPFLLIMINIQVVFAQKDNFELITYPTEDNGVIEAALFKAENDLVVIFAHGAIFNKESWFFMAKKLQKLGISSLSIDFRGYGKSKKGSTGKKAYDILGAIDFLKEKGYDQIAIVGGSMGGAAVLDALEIKMDKAIKKVVLLAPAGGSAIQNKSVNKLFVVSKNEGLFSRVNSIYNDSTQPKKLKVFSGSSHAQHLFKSKHSDELSNLLIGFLTKPK